MRARRFHDVARPYGLGEHGSAGRDAAHSEAAGDDVAHGAAHRVATKPDLVVLVDFGVFNLRLATTLRRD